MRKFKSSQKDESRAQSADSSKAFTVTQELSIVIVRRVIFYSWCGPLYVQSTPLKLKRSTLGLHFQ